MNYIKLYIFSFISVLLVGCNTSTDTKHDTKTTNKSATSSNYQEKRERPNVLIVFPDQLRRYAAGFWSKDKYKKYVVGEPDNIVTPNIDRLAEEGVVLTNAISNFPLCSPYRGMFMSGTYPEENGIWNNCRVGRDFSLNANIETIPDVFHDAGYNTSYFGKCHWLVNKPLFDDKGNYQGTTDSPGGKYMNEFDTYVPPGPDRHGIEYFFQSVKDQHFNPHVYSSNPNVIDGKKDGELYLPKRFSAEVEAENIITYLKNENNERDTNKPFCMIWAINPPHQPWDDANTDMNTLNKYYSKDKYPTLDSLVTRKNADLKVANYTRNYLANATSADFYMGQVLDQLEKMGELDNTIVIFTSDHGEMLGSHHFSGKNRLKTEAYAIPFIVHWPKGLKPNVSEVLFGATDVFPTILALAGLEDKIPSSVKGLNLAKFIENPNLKTDLPKSELLMLSNARGLETNRYTLVLRENITQAESDTKKGTAISEMYYYDNEKDPYQYKKLKLDMDSDLSKSLLSELASKLKLADDPWYKEKKYSEIIPY